NPKHGTLNSARAPRARRASPRSPDWKPNGIDQDIIPIANRIQSLTHLAQSGAFQGDNKGQNLFRVFFEIIALRQSSQLFFAMSELPDLGNIHRQTPEGLTDIADDPGAIFHNKAHIERARDLFRRLNS